MKNLHLLFILAFLFPIWNVIVRDAMGRIVIQLQILENGEIDLSTGSKLPPLPLEVVGIPLRNAS